MSKADKLLSRILSARSDNTIGYEEIRNLLKRLGFYERIKGSHHIYHKKGVDEIINIQSKNGMTKPYQIKQIRKLIVKYKFDLNK